ncbi:class I SAM-dependent methyltransferase [Alteraurantiacibacter buctensis]|uniref:Methyltransferase domain-containing protein n=1 Tax=Alteraurantiacibacter buctensis TaxID=1503981 RepID=A0A844YZD4_9SPHN|nr:class I SAM-dependent methyltransferase [Alteraurantiacibacter buctensis]MXO72310.1 methyltransferase domain-containing protein [Alteraurantiacibacter buctensis]
MGLGRWYEEKVLPRIIGAGCGSAEVTELRRKVVPLARGAVFEIGCGGGFNQQLYDPQAVSSFAGLDPNPALLDAARARAAEKGWAADIRQGAAEAIPFADASFDTVVCTYTLCSVDDQARALAEMRRVLKPGGALLYLEHGRAPDAGPRKWQQRIEPAWKKLMGNCHLTREVGGAIAPAGFTLHPAGQDYFAGAPRWASWMEWGTAVKAGD